MGVNYTKRIFDQLFGVQERYAIREGPMLPRRVIIEHSLDVMECLLLRGRDERTIRAINTIHEIGPRLSQAIQRRDSLRAEKNVLSGQFRTADAAGKERLRARSKELTVDIEMAEDDAHCLSREIEEHERIIPNIPAPDVPLPSHLSEEEAAWKRLLLRRVHRLIAEENGSPSSAGIDHE